MFEHWTDDLHRLHACVEAVRWARRYPSLDEAWKVCHRPSWQMWLIGRCSGKYASEAKRKFAACLIDMLPPLTMCDFEAKLACKRLLRRFADGDVVTELELLKAGRYAHGTICASAVYAVATEYPEAYAHAVATEYPHNDNRDDCRSIIRKHYPEPPCITNREM